MNQRIINNFKWIFILNVFINFVLQDLLISLNSWYGNWEKAWRHNITCNFITLFISLEKFYYHFFIDIKGTRYAQSLDLLFFFICFKSSFFRSLFSTLMFFTSISFERYCFCFSSSLLQSQHKNSEMINDFNNLMIFFNFFLSHQALTLNACNQVTFMWVSNNSVCFFTCF